MIDVFVISFYFFNNKKYLIAFPFDFLFFRLPKRRRQKYGMDDQQNRIVETMLHVFLKKLVGNMT
jgi:hypothetical protein